MGSVRAFAGAVADGRAGDRLWLYATYHCNLACSYCLTESHRRIADRRTLPPGVMLQAVGEAAALGFGSVGITGGEVFMLRSFPKTLVAIAGILPTVALSNGTTENIRCKADYKVNANGLGLKQNLHCASDSYRFDLSSDVTSQGDRISGNWSEKSRNIFGNLQGTAGNGQIEVFVEASGFAANLTLRTNGTKQVVQIDSKGEIRGVTITMTKG